MNVVVAVRTRNEESRIAKFCAAYKDADYIVVSDGGSDDKTVEIASSFHNVVLAPFNERTELAYGIWRNNDSDHANHLFQAAENLNPDWIIYDDCDCRPNRVLKEDYRLILENTTDNVVMVTRFYFWGTERHFPKLARPGREGNLEPSVWAWRGNMNVRTVNIPPAYTFTTHGIDVKDFHKDSTVLDLYPPYALLHYAWDEERIKQKLIDYKESGLIPGFVSPLNNPQLGELVNKEEWMVE